jgi:ATP-dependent helicase YprA (DUF1998 family)
VGTVVNRKSRTSSNSVDPVRHNSASDPISLLHFIETLERDKRFSASLAHHQFLAAHPLSYADPSAQISTQIQKGLKSLGIKQIYSHQAAAIDLIRGGLNVVAVTPTASGKSLLYNLPVLERMVEEPDSLPSCSGSSMHLISRML